MIAPLLFGNEGLKPGDIAKFVDLTPSSSIKLFRKDSKVVKHPNGPFTVPAGTVLEVDHWGWPILRLPPGKRKVVLKVRGKSIAFTGGAKITFFPDNGRVVSGTYLGETSDEIQTRFYGLIDAGPRSYVSFYESGYPHVIDRSGKGSAFDLLLVTLNVGNRGGLEHLVGSTKIKVAARSHLDFHKNGVLAAATLAEDATIGGIKYTKGTEIFFDARGAVTRSQKARD